jgi:VWFA-related protein
VNPKSLPVVLQPTLLIACASLVLAQTPLFKVDTNLQSIAVQVTDKQGNYVHGLAVSDFTLLEDGRPQKIAFFESESQPISLAVLMDVGRSMDWGGKLDRALVLLAPLIRGNLPEDEIFFMPFTDETGPFEQLTDEQRMQRPTIPLLGHRGSAVYDALASALCHMRAAKNVRQAIVVITDGVDEHSRLRRARWSNARNGCARGSYFPWTGGSSGLHRLSWRGGRWFTAGTESDERQMVME